MFSSEWDRFAQLTYEANYGDKPAGDIQQIDTDSIPPFDILVAGFPCQPFSIAGVSKNMSLGRQHGFDHAKQGNMFFEIERILKAKQPPAFMLENVKNLINHEKGITFMIITDILHDLGYSVSTKIIDGKYYVPQHRERTYIVGFTNRLVPEDFSFPFPEPENTVDAHKLPKLRDILEKGVDDKYTLTDNLWAYLQTYAEKHKLKGNGFGFSIADPESHTRTLSARYYKDGSEILIAQKGKNPRRLTPRECARLMGFPDSHKIPVSDLQAYKQFGNSIVVPVVTDVARRIVKILDKYYGQNITKKKKRKYVSNKSQEYQAGVAT